MFHFPDEARMSEYIMITTMSMSVTVTPTLSGESEWALRKRWPMRMAAMGWTVS